MRRYNTDFSLSLWSLQRHRSKEKKVRKKKKRRATSIKARGVTKAWTNQQVESESWGQGG